MILVSKRLRKQRQMKILEIILEIIQKQHQGREKNIINRNVRQF